jgi:transposase-like protein
MSRRWKDVHHAEAFPREFREDVIRVYKDSDASVAQVAKDSASRRRV